MLEFLKVIADLLALVFYAATLWFALDALEARVVDLHAELWRREPSYEVVN